MVEEQRLLLANKVHFDVFTDDLMGDALLCKKANSTQKVSVYAMYYTTSFLER